MARHTWSEKKYYLNPKTGNPYFVDSDNITSEEILALELCTTQRWASDVMSQRIKRMCKMIQDSWKDEEMENRWFGNTKGKPLFLTEIKMSPVDLNPEHTVRKKNHHYSD
tara:strand:+ start:666 stop:995 length:330 start_codon:yes stop_codon:yes gene_type:complete